MKLRLSSDFALDTDDYKREGLRFSILAMSGHGKSNAAADIVEDVLDNHAQVIIIEPIPEWHTLKARYNNVVVIGGPYQDLPLESGFAHEYVKAALEKGISLVVNVSDIEDETDQVKFVSSFLWNLYRLEQKYRRVLFLMLEEADVWAPQMWDQNTKQSLSRVSLIAKHGRKIGIFPILISQRPADLHKSPLSQCNINLFGKFTSPADLDAKTGVMFVAKKLHLPITEQQIMQLPTGHFILSDRHGVHTVAVRKRSCPHGADTPLIEAKPFAADLFQALGTLRDDISRALDAKKEEQDQVRRLEKENAALRRTNEDLQEKANIKVSVREMFSHDTGKSPAVAPSESALLANEKAELEEFRSGRKVAEDVRERLEFLGKTKTDLEETIKKKDEDLKVYNEFRDLFGRMFPQPKAPSQGLNPGGAMGLQKVTKVVDVPEMKKSIGVFPTDTVKGKILALAKDEAFFKGWRSVGEISSELIEKYRFNATEQAINGALKDLVDEHILGMKHTDRNRWSLAPDVVFKGEKEVVNGLCS